MSRIRWGLPHPQDCLIKRDDVSIPPRLPARPIQQVEQPLGSRDIFKAKRAFSESSRISYHLRKANDLLSVFGLAFRYHVNRDTFIIQDTFSTDVLDFANSAGVAILAVLLESKHAAREIRINFIVAFPCGLSVLAC